MKLRYMLDSIIADRQATAPEYVPVGVWVQGPGPGLDVEMYYLDRGPNGLADRKDEAAKIIMAKARTIVSYIFRRRRDEPMLYPDYARGYVDDFLRMCFAVPYEPFESDPLYVHALGRLLIIHADHEQNCSTSTVRLVGSSMANLYASICSGICALWGPLHGGANQKVIEMLEEIQSSKLSIQTCIDSAKDKTSKFRLFGFGHRVYKNYDPRARILKQYCETIFQKHNYQDPLINIAMELEEAALKDDFFIQRKLYPNVDFYSGILYRMIGIPTNMFTVMFAIGRLPGMIAQWKEMHDTVPLKIGRPRQIYTGSNLRHYIPIDERG